MRASLSVLLLLGLARPATAAEAPVLARAIEEGNVDALARLVADEPRSEQGQAAKAVLASLRNQGSEVDSNLAKALALRLSREDRALIHKEMANSRLRGGHYRDALEHLESAVALWPPLDDEPMRQTIAFLKPIATIPSGTRTGSRGGVVPIIRDRAGLPRIPVMIGPVLQSMVVDTGANFSTVTQSTAAKLGLRILEQGVSVASVARDDVRTRIGIADELRIDGMQLHNVVFIVVPDEAMSFAHGAYRIEAILGFPVLLGMRRFAFVSHRSDGETFVFGTALKRTGAKANLMFSGSEPVLLAGHGLGAPLRMFVDSGARTTTLYRHALALHPQLLQGARQQVIRLGGVGGTREEASFTLPKVSIAVSARNIDLADIPVITLRAPDRDGAIGQDVLRQGTIATFDFEAMNLCLGADFTDCPATRGLQRR